MGMILPVKLARNITFLVLLVFASQSLILAQQLPASIRYKQQDIKVGDKQFSFTVPDGYELELLTNDMQRPRLFSFDQAGNMLVGSRSGNIYRLKPPYTSAESILFLSDYPHSMVVRDGYLYVAQTAGLYRIQYGIDQKHWNEEDMQLIASIPGGGGHNSRTLKIGPDNRLYLSLGIRGNCSQEYLHHSYSMSTRRGGVMVLDETGPAPQWQTWANGLRNPVGFDWHPVTGVMYASNNGPDHLGYEQPPESFARLDKDSFHGMPWFQFDGKKIIRDNCITSEPPRRDVTQPVAIFPARNAPMDVHFIKDGQLASQYLGDAIVALHGSWGTQPDGSGSGHPATRRPPKLVLVRFVDGKVSAVDDLVVGFQNEDGERFARPMGVGTGPDGVLYFTSDGGINGLYRLKKMSDGK